MCFLSNACGMLSLPVNIHGAVLVVATVLPGCCLLMGAGPLALGNYNQTPRNIQDSLVR